MKNKNQRKHAIRQFLFPFWPLKWSTCAPLITLLGALIAVRLILQFFSVPLGPAFRLSISWAPTMLLGWIFGPVSGLLLGVITDTLSFLISGGIWFWLYAIQEPLLMFVAGLIGSVYRVRINIRGWISDYCAFQVIASLFLVVAILSLYAYGQQVFATAVRDPFGWNAHNTLILTAVCLACFYLCSQIVIHVLLFNRKHRREEARVKLFIYVVILCLIASLIFSFILGTLAAVAYLAFLTGYTSMPANWTTYGAYYYLIPRVIKETFKLPLMLVLLSGMLRVCLPHLQAMSTLNQTRY